MLGFRAKQDSHRRHRPARPNAKAGPAGELARDLLAAASAAELAVTLGFGIRG
jgi:hypothetical protein